MKLLVAPLGFIVELPAMDPVLITLLPLAACIGGLMLLSVALLCGVWVVQRLRLPTDLPEALLYAPLPVAFDAKPEAAICTARAAKRAKVYAVYQAVRAFHHQEALIQEAQQYWQTQDAARAERLAQALTTISAPSQELRGLVERHDDAALSSTWQRLEPELNAALAPTAEALGALPGPNRTRLLLLIAALGLVLIVWAWAMSLVRDLPA